ncbi:hypothetical protein, partial [Kitasatospora nipponensis]|uniref:hypothetical protein n=1 Tax=Kitasatospora nipponensis TaxID=258049 RepID=UPI0031D92E1A
WAVTSIPLWETGSQLSRIRPRSNGAELAGSQWTDPVGASASIKGTGPEDSGESLPAQDGPV